MKDSIADIWLLGLIIVFILIFACYITITINYTASFKLKNEMLSIIERHKGMTDNAPNCGVQSNLTGKSGSVCAKGGAFQTINLYLRGSAYTAKGQCPTDGDTWYGVKTLDYYEHKATEGTDYEKAKVGEKYHYCFAKYDTGRVKNAAAGSKYSSIYYKVRLFYKFEFPVLTEFLSIRVDGMTDEIYNPEKDLVSVSNGDFFIAP